MLGELNDAVLEHFKDLLVEKIDTGIPEERIFLSPVDDNQTHYKQLEVLLEGQISFPFAVIVRNDIRPDILYRKMHNRQNSAENVIVKKYTVDDTATNPNSRYGRADTVTAAPMQVDYFLRVYASNPDHLDAVLEGWMLLEKKGFEYLEYEHPEIPDEPLGISLAFESPTQVKSNIDQRRSEGIEFYQDIPFELTTVIISGIVDKPLILNVTPEVQLVNKADAFPET